MPFCYQVNKNQGRYYCEQTYGMVFFWLSNKNKLALIGLEKRKIITNTKFTFSNKKKKLVDILSENSDYNIITCIKVFK